jgi:hypothetical protein
MYLETNQALQDEKRSVSGGPDMRGIWDIRIAMMTVLPHGRRLRSNGGKKKEKKEGRTAS